MSVKFPRVQLDASDASREEKQGENFVSSNSDWTLRVMLSSPSAGSGGVVSVSLLLLRPSRSGTNRSSLRGRSDERPQTQSTVLGRHQHRLGEGQVLGLEEADETVVVLVVVVVVESFGSSGGGAV